MYLADYKQAAIFPVLTRSDSDFYYQRAQDIAGGDFLNSKAFMRWPFYAYFLAFLLKLTANDLSFVFLLQFILGTATCLMFYLIARMLFNPAVAFLTAFFYSVYAIFIFYEGLLIYSSLSLFLNALLFFWILRIRERPDGKRLFWIGLLLGIAAITQANVVLFGICAIFLVLWGKSLNFKQLSRLFLCFMLGFSVIPAALVVRSAVLDNDPFLISGNTGFNFYLGNNPRSSDVVAPPQYLMYTPDGALKGASAIARLESGRNLTVSQVSRFWLDKSWNFISCHPAAYLKLLLKKIVSLFDPRERIFDSEYKRLRDKIRIFTIMLTDLRLVMPFAFLGIFLGLKEGRRLGLLYLAVFTFSASIVLFFVQTKLRITLVPFLMLFCAYGIYKIGEAACRRQYLKLELLFLATGALFVLFYRPPARTDIVLQAKEAEFGLHFAKAVEYEQGLNFPATLNELKEADAIQPENHIILFELGRTYYNLHELDKAEEKFKEAIRVSPFFVEAYDHLSVIYKSRKQTDEAITMLRRVAFLDPDDLRAMFELIKAYREKGMFEEAGKQLRILRNHKDLRPQDRAALDKEFAGMDK
jgi:tetratricopeptide (TPR) repeat protein